MNKNGPSGASGHSIDLGFEGFHRYIVLAVRSSVIGTGKIAFIFTGNQYMRPDYLQCVENTATQARNSTLFLIDRKSTKLSIRNIIKLPFIFIWANRLNAIVRDRWISLDMAVSVFRSVNQANFFINAIKKFRCEKVVTASVAIRCQK